MTEYKMPRPERNCSSDPKAIQLVPRLGKPNALKIHSFMRLGTIDLPPFDFGPNDMETKERERNYANEHNGQPACPHDGLSVASVVRTTQHSDELGTDTFLWLGLFTELGGRRIV